MRDGSLTDLGNRRNDAGAQFGQPGVRAHQQCTIRRERQRSDDVAGQFHVVGVEHLQLVALEAIQPAAPTADPHGVAISQQRANVGVWQSGGARQVEEGFTIPDAHAGLSAQPDASPAIHRYRLNDGASQTIGQCIGRPGLSIPHGGACTPDPQIAVVRDMDRLDRGGVDGNRREERRGALRCNHALHAGLGDDPQRAGWGDGGGAHCVAAYAGGRSGEPLPAGAVVHAKAIARCSEVDLSGGVQREAGERRSRHAWRRAEGGGAGARGRVETTDRAVDVAQPERAVVRQRQPGDQAHGKVGVIDFFGVVDRPAFTRHAIEDAIAPQPDHAIWRGDNGAETVAFQRAVSCRVKGGVGARRHRDAFFTHNPDFIQRTDDGQRPYTVKGQPAIAVEMTPRVARFIVDIDAVLRIADDKVARLWVACQVDDVVVA